MPASRHSIGSSRGSASSRSTSDFPRFKGGRGVARQRFIQRNEQIPKVKDTGKGWKIGRGGDGMEISKGFKPSDLGLPMAKKKALPSVSHSSSFRSNKNPEYQSKPSRKK